jgi:pimeloyl-ACP methyl ester carboxylesterase
VPLVPGLHYEVGIASTIGTNGSILEFVPLVPLAPDTTYAFLLTDGITSAAGIAAGPDTVFGLVRDAHLAGLATTGNAALDALLPAIGPLIDAATGLLGLPGNSIVSAWSVSTQSIGDTFNWLEANATAQLSLLTTAGITTGDLGLGLPGNADLYVGFMEVPYYGNPADTLGSIWINASFQPLTRDDPVPLAQGGLKRIPVLASLPNAGSGQSKPAGGWPVVLLLHGVTANRTVMLPMADSFAAAGFAVVAIDMPLHGVTDTASPFYQGPGSPFGDNERHFNLDNVGAVGVTVPDGAIDSGWQILNISNPLNGRDHGRQATADLIHATKTLPTMDFDSDMAPDLDGNRIHFVSVSLGSIYSMAYVATNAEHRTVTMSSPGGPFSEFLYDPDAIAFGAPFVAGIEAAGLPFNTVGFNEFARDLQTILDPIDPVNYAATAAASKPIHVIEVLGDPAVTPALTDNLAELMGLTSISTSTVDGAGLRGIVRFTAGGHTSIFNPAIDLDVTIEMQTQTASFAASDGAAIVIGDESLVQQ